MIDIVVIRLPHISNFTDFSPFERYENVSVRYISSVADLSRPDIIFLPGTKSTISDLQWLRQSGLEAAIKKEADAGTLIIGICGGYQMLGTKICDPEGVEAAGIKEISGIGLLENETIFRSKKVQKQISGAFEEINGYLSSLTGIAYQGYEIHMGQSTKKLSVLVGNCNVYGSYVHGIFDAAGISNAILKVICEQKGIDFEAMYSFHFCDYKEQQYNLLADAVRQGLNMDLIYRVVNREV